MLPSRPRKKLIFNTHISYTLLYFMAKQLLAANQNSVKLIFWSIQPELQTHNTKDVPSRDRCVAARQASKLIFPYLGGEQCG